nr:glycosyltransferase family 1 protein [uncultured Flavobacterium sp.]
MKKQGIKIVVDPQIFDDQLYGGISRYYIEILSRQEKKGNKITIPILTSRNFYIRQSIFYNKKQQIVDLFIKVMNRYKVNTNTFIDKQKKKELNRAFTSDYDVLVPTYFNPYFYEQIGNKPFVLTVYDMIYELFPDLFIDDPHNVVANKLFLIEKATKIIAVSNNTKKDILKLYPHIDESKIEVIYHGNSIKVEKNIDIKLPENYILYVGSRWHYKNFTFLVDAVKDILDENDDLILLCAGGGDFNEEEKALIHDLDLDDKIVQQKFEDFELGHYYKNALCFVFPSMYEGFGIPVLESMACGCPIVLSNSSSFPEVAGEAGIFFNLGDKQDLQNKIRMLLNNDLLRAEYSQKGLIQVKNFDWDDAAEKCLEVYIEAVNS